MIRVLHNRSSISNFLGRDIVYTQHGNSELRSRHTAAGQLGFTFEFQFGPRVVMTITGFILWIDVCFGYLDGFYLDI